jgi:hypothetical protein
VAVTSPPYPAPGWVTTQVYPASFRPLELERIYGAFFVRGKGIVPSLGKEVVRRSAERYLKAIHG